MVHSALAIVIVTSFGVAGTAQIPYTPDLAAQRAAMKKLAFLVGKWSGDASMLRTPGQAIEMSQTEEAQFKLDGLILQIEGVGRAKSDGKPILQAFGLISFDDESRTYQMRAFNDGRWLECEVKPGEDGASLSWGFTIGPVKTSSVLRINQEGDWTESHEITIGTAPARHFMDVTVRRVKPR